MFDVSREPPVFAHLGALDGTDDRLNVIAAFDLNGDGEPELLSGPDGEHQSFSLIRRDGNAFEKEDVFTIPYFDCPC